MRRSRCHTYYDLVSVRGVLEIILGCELAFIELQFTMPAARAR